MFYTLEEAADKLGKTADEIRQMASSGQLPEFRDRDRLMFKVEHVDLISGASKKDDDDIIPLADSGELEPVSLSSSGSASAIGLESPKEQTGISIFDADATEEADPSAVTRITNAPQKLEDPGRSGSGSGLLDMTRDVDDTSLGANLLDDVYGGQETIAQQTTEEPAMGTGAGMEGGALFETPAADGDAALAGAGAAAPAYVVQEAYDGAGSGLVGGLAIGAVAALLLSAFAIMLGINNSGTDVLKTLGDNMWAFVGGLAGLTVVGAGLGMVLGKRS